MGLQIEHFYTCIFENFKWIETVVVIQVALLLFGRNFARKITLTSQSFRKTALNMLMIRTKSVYMGYELKQNVIKIFYFGLAIIEHKKHNNK